MPDKPVLVASDVHLGATAPEQERAFYEWLVHAQEAASQVVLNGDLFDFWFEYRSGIPPGHDTVLALLRDAVDAGVPVTLMGGNHDWWGGRFLRDEVGVEFLQDPVVRTYAGLRTFLAHGDGLGKGDLGYRALRLVLRGRVTRWAFGQLPPDVGSKVAAMVSRTDERWRSPGQEEEERSAALEAWARGFLGRTPDIDLVLLGHTHLPRIVEVEPGRWYVNTGDWVFHRSYLVLESGAPPRLEEWTG